MTIATYRDMTGPNGLLATRVDFTGNSMSAITFTGISPWGHGRLDADERREYDTFCDFIERNHHLSGYVVRSYGTPIAWAVDGEPAYIVGQRFSVTTSKGQNYVRAWINHYYGPDTVSGFALYRSERQRLGI